MSTKINLQLFGPLPLKRDRNLTFCRLLYRQLPLRLLAHNPVRNLFIPISPVSCAGHEPPLPSVLIRHSMQFLSDQDQKNGAIPPTALIMELFQFPC